MEVCKICKEKVNGPCVSNEEALQEGCINPPQKKRLLLNPDIAKRVESQLKGSHGVSSGPGSFTD